MLEHEPYTLLTGASGYIGRLLLKHWLEQDPTKAVVALTRDEQKLLQLRYLFPQQHYPRLQLFLGDIRSTRRMHELLQLFHCKCIVHAAALKHVPLAEEYPEEYIQTNIIGTQNLLQAALTHGTEQFIFISTDKAFSAQGVYAATKRCAEQVLIAQLQNQKKIRIGILRAGNLIGAQHTVTDIFLQSKQELIITHPHATRFFLPDRQLLAAINHTLSYGHEAEIIIPKMRSARIIDIANWLRPELPLRIMGLRKGEKIHEILFDESLQGKVAENEQYFIIFPDTPSQTQLKKHHAIQLNITKAFSSENHLIEQADEFFKHFPNLNPRS